jgi:serine/threonine-protein kinase
MSPEQALGDHDPDVRGDIYSLGAVAYYLLTGRPPFDDEKPLKVMFAHAKEVPTPPSEIHDGIPDDLEAIVMRCLEKDPAARFQNIEGLFTALDECELLGSWNDGIAEHWWRESSAAKVAVG